MSPRTRDSSVGILDSTTSIPRRRWTRPRRTARMISPPPRPWRRNMSRLGTQCTTAPAHRSSTPPRTAGTLSCCRTFPPGTVRTASPRASRRKSTQDLSSALETAASSLHNTPGASKPSSSPRSTTYTQRCCPLWLKTCRSRKACTRSARSNLDTILSGMPRTFSVPQALAPCLWRTPRTRS